MSPLLLNVALHGMEEAAGCGIWPARMAAISNESPCAGLTLYAVLRELQQLLAVITGACNTCGQTVELPQATPT